MFHDYESMMFGHGWGMLFWLLLLMVLIWLLVRQFSGRDDGRNQTEKAAREILDERFASSLSGLTNRSEGKTDLS